jgi:putative transposase
MYNALLGEAMRRMRLMKESRLYQAARRIPRDEAHADERKSAFAAARAEHGFTEYHLSQYATTLRGSWIGTHIGAHLAQKLVKRAFEAANKVACGRARNVRFKTKSRGLHSLEGKNNEANLVWRTDHLEWGTLSLPMVRQATRDPVIRHGLSSRVKYVRLVRREFRGRHRFYAQLVCEGLPYKKAEHPIGTGTVGLDIGPSTIAVVGETQASLEQFCAPVVRDHKQIRRLQRKLDRQRRANNPDCYDAQGRVIKGKRPKHKSRRQARTEAVLQNLYRCEAAHRKTLHGQMANRILAIGADIRTEKLSFKAFQRMYGRSIAVRAPRMFLSILTRKAESAGGQVYEFNTRTTALSQVCLCGQRHKKRLSERIHACDCGVEMQRDLFSAFLARHVKDNLLQVTEANESWSGAEPLLRAAWRQATENQQPASGRHTPSSFGTCRCQSQSGSSEKVCATVGIVGNPAAESGEAVALSQERGESPAKAPRVPVFADRTPWL